MDVAVTPKTGRLQPLSLRDYQQECLDVILAKYQAGVRRQLVSMATGAGKTVVFSHVIKTIRKPTLVLAHTNELLSQARDKIQMILPGVSVGIVNGTSKEIDRNIVIASIQSARQPKTLSQLVNRGFEVLIADECHHFAAESCREVISALGFDGTNNKLMVGFTATPFRQDGLGLGEVFDEIVFEKSIGSLIEEGYLCPPTGIRVATDLDLREVALTRGDFSAKGMATVMNTAEVRALTVQTYLEHAKERPTICFACSVDHALCLANDFRAAGVRSETVHGQTSPEDRERIISAYRGGEIDVITNCQVLTEGFDMPATSCVLVARPTSSKGLYQQMVGRGLRRSPDKRDCLVIDFNDSTHTLCNASVLMPDAEVAEQQEEERKAREKQLLEEIPDTLNRKLKSAYVSSNLMGDMFNWNRNGQGYSLKGNDNTELLVTNCGEDYRVVMRTAQAATVLADSLSFEYAFAAAEDYARANRGLFLLADRDALWRKGPISERQREILRSKGYRAGIDQLTKGQASDLIGSGALRRTA